LWVVPLALYLLTFVALFRERPWVGHETTIKLVPFVVAALSISVLGGDKVFWLTNIALSLTGFLVLSMLCHGELYWRRPAPARLTEFYLWVSIGGVLGGIFAGLLAPYLFSSTYEYPILIAAALLVLPGTFTRGREGFLHEAGPALALAALVIVPRVLFDVQLPEFATYPFQIGLVALAGLMVIYRQRPARLFSLVVLAFVVTGIWQPGLARVENVRSFFGVHKVSETADGRHRLLFHGTTIHGAEKVREANGTLATGRPEPLTYYYFGGPISEAIDAARAAQSRLRAVAAVGLGTGSLACHIKNGERWTFFEIDPEVVRLARNPKLFRYINECAARLPVVLGDARLTLAASAERYDLIVLDAFSSDAIPVHLLTREAVQSYLARLNPRGLIVVHISNRHMELEQVVGAVAAAEGLVAMAKFDEKANQLLVDYKAKAHVAVLARTPSDLRTLAQKPGWKRIDPGQVVAWTDDYSNILSAILRKKLGR
jgi:predicted O-methyltransferase YrrM